MKPEELVGYRLRNPFSYPYLMDQIFSTYAEKTITQPRKIGIIGTSKILLALNSCPTRHNLSARRDKGSET
jgi:hypothetical protein